MNCTRLKQIRCEEGFTLLELCVAAALFAVAATALGAVFRNSMVLWKRADREIRIHREAQVFFDQFGRDFRNAIDVPGAWSISQDAISFATLRDIPVEPLEAASFSRMVRVTYGLSPGGAFSRSEQNMGPVAPDLPMLSIGSYHADVVWEFAYRGRSSTEVIRWEKEGTVKRLPAGVRIQLTLYDKNGAPQLFTRSYFSPIRDLATWRP